MLPWFLAGVVICTSGEPNATVVSWIPFQVVTFDIDAAAAASAAIVLRNPKSYRAK